MLPPVKGNGVSPDPVSTPLAPPALCRRIPANAVVAKVVAASRV